MSQTQIQMQAASADANARERARTQAPRSGWLTRALALCVCAVALAGLSISACSSEDPVLFGNPDCPAGRCQSGATGSSSSGGTDCVPSGNVCMVRFGDDIFKPLFDATGAAKCADVTCHGDPANVQGRLLLVPGDAVASRQALLDYQFDNPAGPYITCTTPADSKILCNMSLGATANPYGKCSLTMPVVDNVGAQTLTQAQLELIAQWIACGAPNN